SPSAQEPSGRHTAPVGLDEQSITARMTQSPDTPSEQALCQTLPLTLTVLRPAWQPSLSETSVPANRSLALALKKRRETTNVSPASTGMEMGMVWFSSS